MVGLNRKKLFYKEGVIIRCETLDECFFVHAFFSTKKSKKSSRHTTRCPLFVVSTEFVFVVAS